MVVDAAILDLSVVSHEMTLRQLVQRFEILAAPQQRVATQRGRGRRRRGAGGYVVIVLVGQGGYRAPDEGP